MAITLFMVIWTICGVLTYGITLAYFQRNYPEIAKEDYREDVGFSVLFGIVGPIGLFVSLWGSGFAKHGLMYRRRK